VNVIRGPVLAALMFVAVIGCKSEPKILSLTGPTTGSAGDALEFRVRGEDPGGRDLSYEMDWGDTSSLAWTAPYASGKEATLRHVYTDTGEFRVRAKARTDSENESTWSDSVRVLVHPPEAPQVSIEAVDTGKVLRLSWTAVPGADSYRVTFDGAGLTTTGLSVDIGGPMQLMSVYALSGTLKGDAAYIDCTPVVSTFTVYSDSDTTKPCAFGFAPDGTATDYLLQPQNYTYLDFVVDDKYTPVGLVNAGDYLWPQSPKLNGLIEASWSDFDAYDMAASTGAGYMTQSAISAGGLYAFWNGLNAHWSTGDRFCKAKVISIEQAGSAQKVTMKVACQKIGGLRWLKTQ